MNLNCFQEQDHRPHMSNFQSKLKSKLKSEDKIIINDVYHYTIHPWVLRWEVFVPPIEATIGIVTP